MKRSLTAASVIVASMTAGCPSPATMPKTYSVSGQVVYRDGKPFGPAAIEFRSLEQQFNAIGAVGPDGQFSLSTMGVPGSVDGACQVTVIPKHSWQAVGGALMPIVITGKFVVRAEDDNAFKLVVPQNSPR